VIDISDSEGEQAVAQESDDTDGIHFGDSHSNA